MENTDKNTFKNMMGKLKLLPESNIKIQSDDKFDSKTFRCLQRRTFHSVSENKIVQSKKYRMQRKVEDNLGLVHKVINDKVHGPYQIGIYSREDLFQIGCIGLCKAVATDKGGNFSTYAYRLIWNQICDALIYSTRRQANETTYDVTPFAAESGDTDIELGIAIEQALEKAKLEAPPSTVKGIDAIKLMSRGYTCREIGEEIGATDKQVAAMVSKARKFLKDRKDVLDLAGNI